MRTFALLSVLLCAAPVQLAAAPAHRHVVVSHRHVRKKAEKKKPTPTTVKIPQPVCHRTVLRVRTGKVIKLVPKERCF